MATQLSFLEEMGLELVSLGKASKDQDPIALRKKMLTDLLTQQSRLVEAKIKGEEYRRKINKYVKDEAGNKTKETIDKKLRQWWIEKPDCVLFFVKNGKSQKLQLGPGLEAIKVPNLEALPAVIAKIVEAIDVGHFDDQMKEALHNLDVKKKERDADKKKKEAEAKTPVVKGGKPKAA
jgi:hypothetical protein